MKKIMITLVLGIIFLANGLQDAMGGDTWYVGLRVGIRAKFQIILGNKDCKDGNSFCFVLWTDSPQNFFGYEADTDKFYIKISKRSPEAIHFSNETVEVPEDSWVDPDLISALTKKYTGMKVFVKQGVYKVMDSGDFYLVGVDYYAQ
jgi:hypothetical protein